MADLILVEDEAALRRYLAGTLRGLGHTVREASSGEDGLESLAQGEPDLIITDHRLPGMNGLELLRHVRGSHPSVAVIVLTAHGTVEDAVEAMKSGAVDYLNKPIDRAELDLVVRRTLESRGRHNELQYYRSRDLPAPGLKGIVGDSEPVRKLRAFVERLASHQKKGGAGPTVLLCGETGTGKGLIARALHQAAPRREEPFVEVNCAALPAELLEAELMGYEKGAFTGATTAKPGLFEAAEGGTIFLDEIGRMDLALQAKLLKVIEERTVRRLGSTRDRPMGCSIITATSIDLERAVADERFLADLYHRVNVFRIDAPALRDRENDVLVLAEHFLRVHAADYGVEAPRLGEDARQALCAYRWPGNIRELSHVIERLVVLRQGQTAYAEDLGLPGSRKAAAVDPLRVDFSRGPVSLEQIDASLIRQAFDFAKGNRARTAELLGISYETLRYRLEKYSIG